MCSSTRGPGDHALARHVPDQQHGGALRLGVANEGRRRFAQLRHRAGRRIDVCHRHRLDGVDHEHPGGGLGGRVEDALEPGLGHQLEPVRCRHPAVARARRPGARIPRRSRTAQAGRGRARRRTAGGASTCRCPARRRSASPTRARVPRPARGRTRQSRSPCASRARSRVARSRPGARRRMRPVGRRRACAPRQRVRACSIRCRTGTGRSTVVHRHRRTNRRKPCGAWPSGQSGTGKRRC